MDGHSGVRALLHFLNRKVEYQKFVPVKPHHEEIPPHKDHLLFLQQRAQASVSCFFLTDIRAISKLLKPIIILVMDLSSNENVVLTIFRHSPHPLHSFNSNSFSKQSTSNNFSHVKNHSRSSYEECDNDKDMLNLCEKFEKLSILDEKRTLHPNIKLLSGPMIVTPDRKSLLNVLKRIGNVLSDFPRQEFDTIVVIGGHGNGVGYDNIHTVGDSDEMNDIQNDIQNDGMKTEDEEEEEEFKIKKGNDIFSNYNDHITTPKGWSWNLLLFLQNDILKPISRQLCDDQTSSFTSFSSELFGKSSKSNLRSSSSSSSSSYGHVLDLDDIPILVHLGGGEFPTACGALPTGLLTNHAFSETSSSHNSAFSHFRDKKSSHSVGSGGIPRSIGCFDLDKDAISEEEEDEGEEGKEEEAASTSTKLSPGH
mmetsp:Transcript_1539/g.1935  ORF Transcript_1539/g.1935 Transcript_1539/m.1935 type:complete len:423 (-) Transcript_1539:1150-2418(-)